MTSLAELEQYVLHAPDSGVETINALLNSGNGWVFMTPADGNTLYYTFSITEATESGSDGLTAFNDSQMTAARAVMAYVATVTGISFIEVTNGNNADIHFAAENLAGTSTSGLCQSNWSYNYDSDTVTLFSEDAYVYLDNVEFNTSNSNPVSGTLGYQVLLHEIGHALGLKHPFETDSTTSGTLDSSLDNTNNTVMSYTLAGAYKTAYQAYDLAALEYIYGGDGLGGTNYGTTIGSIDATTDTTDDSTTTASPTLTGTAANNKLNGSDDVDDWIEGLGGNDQIKGYDGDDRLVGGSGADKLTGGSGADQFVFDNLASGGADKILDFSLTDGDSLVFDSSVYIALADGIDADNLRISSKAKALDSDDFLIFTTKGKLYYDADGSGSASKAILLAGIQGSFSGIDVTSFVIE